jgi:hypothetical protein
MCLTVLRSGTSGTVIVCSRGCLRFRYGHPPLLKVVAPPATDLIWLRREHRLEGLDSEVALQWSIVNVVVVRNRRV